MPGKISFVLLLGLWLVRILSPQPLISFAETYFSPDNHISCVSCMFTNISMSIIVFGLGSILIQAKELQVYKMSKLEYWVKIPSLIKLTSVGLLALILFWVIFKDDFPDLYLEDGFFESGTAILFLMSSTICLFGVFAGSKRNYLLLLPTVLFFVFGMEEISWGQRLMGWQTPSYIERINQQNETNIHNLLNGNLVSTIITTTVALFLLASEKLGKWTEGNRQSAHKLFNYPRREFELIGLILLVLGILNPIFQLAELIEEILSVIAISYSFSIIYNSGKANSNLSSS